MSCGVFNNLYENNEVLIHKNLKTIVRCFPTPKTLSPVGADLTGKHLMKRELDARKKQRESKQERKKAEYRLEDSRILT